MILLIVAMLLPGTDPVTMLIEAVPLLLLYELSVLLARAVGRPPEGAVDRDITVSEPPAQRGGVGARARSSRLPPCSSTCNRPVAAAWSASSSAGSP